MYLMFARKDPPEKMAAEEGPSKKMRRRRPNEEDPLEKMAAKKGPSEKVHQRRSD